jgi:hypothetical protein
MLQPLDRIAAAMVDLTPRLIDGEQVESVVLSTELVRRESARRPRRRRPAPRGWTGAGRARVGAGQARARRPVAIR